MRSTIYISGILGGLLIMIGLIGAITDFNNNALFLITGLALTLLIFIPLLVIDKYKHNKKIKSIIKSYADKPSKPNSISSGKSETKGWSMNNSPYRKRKSGLNWSGGSVHGANASRGTR
ncbi:MAG: hypothetical protein C0597_00135 [Marinilabiliales bacterium]|nr:MAG: hypothetical protein C0597_00135 [Marinilabiliales bacterium]